MQGPGLRQQRKAAEFRLVKELGHPEAFRIEVETGRAVIEADSPAGLIYGAQAVVCDEAQTGQVQRPDFDIRGTTLWLGGAVQGHRIAPTTPDSILTHCRGFSTGRS